MTSLPTVTVVVAAYDYAGYLGRTLDSALQQDYPPELLDVVVVDDGSTDATPAVLADYVARHPGRVTAIRQDNAGYVSATNRALAAARGELVAILDADDVWPADKTRRQVEVLLERPEVGLVYCDTEIIDPYDAVVRPSLWRWLEMEPQRGRCFAEIMGRAGNVALASTILVRRALLDAFAPIPPGAPYVDWWVTARVAQVAEIDWVEGLAVGYRMHGENLTLGATGHRRVRETLKTAEIRRQLLIHDAAAALTDEELVEAFKAFEGAGLTAVMQAGSAYVPLAPVHPAEQAAGERLAAAARDATLAGRWSEALRLRVAAVAHDPRDAVSREWVVELARLEADRPAEATGEPADPLAGARATVVLAFAEELVAEPRMLAAYAAEVAEDADATLVIAAIGSAPQRALERVLDAVHRAGLHPDRLPDLLLVTDAGPGGVVELERRADLVFTRRPRRLAAPCVNPDRAGALRAHVGATAGCPA
jgi:hypothetical protein